MGGSSAGSGSSDSPNTSRSTLSSKNQAKADKKSRADANVEMGLGKDRMSNFSKSQGGTKPDNDGGGDNNNTITQVTKTAPTVAEVSQVTTTDAAAEDTEANRLLKIKKKGRSQSIITGSKGVTKTSTDYSLGKKSLLGRV